MNLPGMTRPLKPIPIFKQMPGEKKKAFFRRMDVTAQVPYDTLIKNMWNALILDVFWTFVYMTWNLTLLLLNLSFSLFRLLWKENNTKKSLTWMSPTIQ